jgi:hypothetical protein
VPVQSILIGSPAMSATLVLNQNLQNEHSHFVLKSIATHVPALWIAMATAFRLKTRTVVPAYPVARLEELTQGTAVKGVLPGCLVLRYINK